MITDVKRTKYSKNWLFEQAVKNLFSTAREICNRSLYEFMKFFWPEYSLEPFQLAWHIEFLCKELEMIADNLALRKPKLHDLVINIPPGTTKTATVSIFFPVWLWTKWYWMRIITAGYSATLSLEAAEYSRDIIKSDKFRALYPELEVKEDKDRIGNYRITKKVWDTRDQKERILLGGNRYSTSVGGTMTGFHGHILIVDDALSPSGAISNAVLTQTNEWMSKTLPTRKVNKLNTVTIVMGQRLHEDDPSGTLLKKGKERIRHINLPGEIRSFKNVHPPELEKFYVNDLLDPVRLGWTALKELEADLGEYGYSAQIGQDPKEVKGEYFKVDHFGILEMLPPREEIEYIVRAWDKAGTAPDPKKRTQPAFTAGVKMARLKNGRFVIFHCKKGQWDPEVRERIILSTAKSDGTMVEIFHEQEPGAGGKESALATNKNLAGFIAHAERPVGDKVFRAGPYAVQVNNGNVDLLKGDWNKEFIDEHRYFPFGRFKDQVDASALAFSKLTDKKMVRTF